MSVRSDIDGMRDKSLETLQNQLRDANQTNQQLQFRMNEFKKRVEDVEFELRNQHGEVVQKGLNRMMVWRARQPD